MLIKRRLTQFFIVVPIIILFLLFLNYAIAANSWHLLAPGIEYRDLDGDFLTPWSHIHAFRIDLKQNQLSLVSANDLARKHASIEEYAHHSKALVAINGGFFDDNHQPLGLRIYNNQLKNPLKQISWWGVFYIQNQRPYISSARQFTTNSQIDFAIQSGPRLLIDNRIPSLKPGQAERSALGITQEGRIIILITDHMPLSTTELARLMRAEPLNCQNALNLDGGSSSQLRAELAGFKLTVHGFANISDAVIVKAKNS